MLGERTAEEVKMTLGSAFPLPDEPEAEIRGRDMVSGLPRTVVVSSAEVRQALEEPLHAIVDAVRATLDQTPPELAGDIMDRGIVLTGGGALLRGLDERLRHETGMPVHVAEDPLTSVALGAGKCVEEFEALQQVLVSGAAGGTDGRLRTSSDRRRAPLARGSSASTATDRPSRAVLVALVLACLTLITLDYRGGADSPVEPARRAVGEVLGPVETGTTARDPPLHRGARSGSTRARRSAATSPGCEAENARLRSEAATADYDRNRLAEYDGLTTAAEDARLRAGPGPGGRHRRRRSRSRAP